MKNIYGIILMAGLSGGLHISANAQQLLAFPTAEGYGKYTVGGRGGDIYEVTNLNDSGPGSLRAAVSASGPRTVVFRVSGTIDLKSRLKISNPYITIAGQTAPGDGICIKRYPLEIGADEVIIRFIRVRLGDELGDEADALGGRYHKNIILDHVSTSWSVDETLSLYHCENVTIQWCISAESLFNSAHPKGAHGFGGIWGSNYSTYHHNLIANHSSRNPRFASGAGYNDYRNNVIYNWGYQSCYGGEAKQVGNDAFNSFYVNFVGNYYKPGAATQPGGVSYRIVNPSCRDENDCGQWYVADNYLEGYPAITADNWAGGVQIASSLLPQIKMEVPWSAMEINEQTAEEAYLSVLENAGAVLPVRDIVDSRIVDEVKGGYSTYEGTAYKQSKKVADINKKCGIIDSQEDVGGWPVLKALPAPIDSDKDGIPDAWEVIHGLDPTNSSDRNLLNNDGYTALEVYLNSLAKEQMNMEFTQTKLHQTKFNQSSALLESIFVHDTLKIKKSEKFRKGQIVTLSGNTVKTFDIKSDALIQIPELHGGWYILKLIHINGISESIQFCKR